MMQQNTQDWRRRRKRWRWRKNIATKCADSVEANVNMFLIETSAHLVLSRFSFPSFLPDFSHAACDWHFKYVIEKGCFMSLYSSWCFSRAVPFHDIFCDNTDLIKYCCYSNGMYSCSKVRTTRQALVCLTARAAWASNDNLAHTNW